MLKTIQKIANERTYNLIHNEEPINITTNRIKGFIEFQKLLGSVDELAETRSYFVYNEQNIATFGLSFEVDVVWVDWDGKIIHIEEGFKMNKISKDFPKTKFIYFLSKGTVTKKKILVNDTFRHRFERK